MSRRTSRLWGRESERAGIRRCLERGARLVTLLGPAGIGKTRLALELLADLEADGRAVMSCDLDPVRGADGLVDAIARSARLRTSGPEDAAGLVRALSLRERAVLLLDNAEHVAEPLAELAASLIERPGDLTLLVTSQVRLHLAEETCFEIGPVPLPVARSIFAQTADRVVPGEPLSPPLVDRVLEGLDGLPLAIELAAGRLRYRTLAELAAAERMPIHQLFRGDRSLPARSRSLKAALQGAWGLLEPSSREAATALAAFEGGFRPEDGAAVLAKAGVAEPERQLEALRDHSMVWSRPWAGRTRLGLFDAVRRFVLEVVTGEAERRVGVAAHAEHFCAAAGRARAEFWGADPVSARAWLLSEQSNLRAAARHLQATDPEGAVDLVRAMGPILIFSAPVEANREVLVEAVRAAARLADPEREARARLDLSSSYTIRGRFDDAWTHLEAAARVAPPERGVRAEIDVARAHVALRQGRLDEAQERLRQVERRAEGGSELELGAQVRMQQLVFAVELAPRTMPERAPAVRKWAAEHGRARLGELSWLLEGIARMSLEQWREAVPPLTRAIEASRRLQEPIYLGWAQSELSRALLRLGQPSEAQRRAERGLDEAERAADSAAEAFLRVVRDEVRLVRDRADLVRRDLAKTQARVHAVYMPPLSRRLSAIEAAVGASPDGGFAEIEPDGRGFSVEGRHVPLLRRRAVRRVLACLAAAALGPARYLPWTELFAAGWPGQAVETSGARQRTYTAIWTLRSLGLGAHIETSSEGYRLVRVRVGPDLEATEVRGAARP